MPQTDQGVVPIPSQSGKGKQFNIHQIGTKRNNKFKSQKSKFKIHQKAISIYFFTKTAGEFKELEH